MEETVMLLIDVFHNEVKTVVIRELQDLYDNLCCSTVEAVAQPISGREFVFYIDEEATFKSPLPPLGAVSPVGGGLLGNILVFKGAGLDGQELSLSDDDIAFLKARIIQKDNRPLLVGLGIR